MPSIRTINPLFYACKSGTDILSSGLLEEPGVVLTGVTLVSGISEDFSAVIGADAYADLVASLDYPNWAYGLIAIVTPMPTIVWHNGLLWRCVQAHTVQADPNYAPDVAHALWTRFFVTGEIPAWVQPISSVDAWPLGAKVTHNGNTWQSAIDANVWEPGAVGNELLWSCLDCAPVAGAWDVSVAYVGDNTAGAGNGDVVTYQGSEYRCLQSHTSQVGWEPPNVPALWIAL